MTSTYKTSHLFLSYHTPDLETVQFVRRLLEARGITTFMDRQNLVAGQPWPQALEQALESAQAVAVFLGRDGLGLWMKRELNFALERQVQEERKGRFFPVIPVLLPGADPTTGFLFQNTWVDFRDHSIDLDGLAPIERAIRGTEPPSSPQLEIAWNPFQGLRAFEEHHAGFYFGREKITNHLINTVLRRNLVAVVGRSGSGKSSIVQAGLIPKLRREHSPKPNWDTAIFQPGAHPYHAMAQALVPLLEPELDSVEQLKIERTLGDYIATGQVTLEGTIKKILTKQNGTDRLLLVADQFEELFTLTPIAERSTFLARLLLAIDQAPLTLVLTIRGDFYGHLIGLNRDLSERLQEKATVNLGPMREEELLHAITRPAQKVGLAFEDGLVDTILKDAGREPGNLPLVEFALTELWNHRRGKILTHEGYKKVGGVQGAIAERAEQEFNRLGVARQRLVRKVFTRLVRVTRPDEGEGYTRRRIPLADFGTEAQRVVVALADARLIVTSRGVQPKTQLSETEVSSATESGTAEVAHEALIRGWGRLREWVNQDREFLLWLERLRLACEQWDSAKRHDSALIRGVLLTEADRWLREREEDLNPTEVAFIRASLCAEQDAKDYQQRQAYEERTRQERRRQAWVVAAVLMIVLALGLGWYALKAQRNAVEAERQASRAKASSIVALVWSVIAEKDPTTAALLLAELGKSNGTPAGGTRAAQRLAGAATSTSILRGHQAAIRNASFSPDGQYVVTASDDGTARVWRTDGKGDPVKLEGHEDVIWYAVFSPDGKFVGTASGDGTARLWPVDGTREPLVLRGHQKAINHLGFSPDGRKVVTGSDDTTVRVWSADGNGEPLVFQGHKNIVNHVSFSPDGGHVVTASDDGTSWVWSSDGSEEPIVLRGHQDWVSHAAFSPDGTKVVTASGDHTARVWWLDGSKAPVVLQGHQDWVRHAVFSPDGAFVVTASGDNTARVYRADGGGTPVVLRGHQNWVWQAAFSHDGKFVVTASGDGTAQVYHADGSGAPIVLRGHQHWLWSAGFSPDGERILTASADRTARVWSLMGIKEPVILSGHNGIVTTATFSADGRSVVTASDDGTARVWRTDDYEEPIVLQGHEDWVRHAAFSPDGRSVVTASDDGTARVWLLNGKSEPAVLRGHQGGIFFAAFSHDGLRVVTASGDGTARVWRVDGSVELAVLKGHKDWVWQAIFSSSGRHVLTASADGTARLWPAKGIGTSVVLRGHQGGVSHATFSPDGQRVVTASDDHTARVWKSTGTGDTIVLEGHQNPVNYAEFSPDGLLVVTASGEGTAGVWPVDGNGERIVLQGHQSEIRYATFSPDGRFVLTASDDGTAKVWPTNGSGEPVTLEGHQGPVYRAEFSPDGRKVATASHDRTARVWTVNWKDLLIKLQGATTACLTVAQRVQYLVESVAEASSNYETCERGHERVR